MDPEEKAGTKIELQTKWRRGVKKKKKKKENVDNKREERGWVEKELKTIKKTPNYRQWLSRYNTRQL